MPNDACQCTTRLRLKATGLHLQRESNQTTSNKSLQLIKMASTDHKQIVFIKSRLLIIPRHFF